MSFKNFPSNVFLYVHSALGVSHKQSGLDGWKRLVLGITFIFFLYDGFFLRAYVRFISHQLSKDGPYAWGLLVFGLIFGVSSRYLRQPLLGLLWGLVPVVAVVPVSYLFWRVECTLFATRRNSLFLLGLLACERLSLFNCQVSYGLLLGATKASAQLARYRYKIRTGQYRSRLIERPGLKLSGVP